MTKTKTSSDACDGPSYEVAKVPSPGSLVKIRDEEVGRVRRYNHNDEGEPYEGPMPSGPVRVKSATYTHGYVKNPVGKDLFVWSGQIDIVERK